MIRFRIIFVLIIFQFFVHAFFLDPPYGQLNVVGRYVIDGNGIPIQLRGMSLFWSQWMPQYYNDETIKHLKNEWNANIVRAAMAVDPDLGGYVNSTYKEVEYGKVKAVIDAAIHYGLYVIVDWHAVEEDPHTEQAISFFTNISKTYSSYPHIIYEIWNEPYGPKIDWAFVKNYSQHVIPAIRANDPTNLIVVGSSNHSHDADLAANDPLNFTNICYTQHYYAGTPAEQQPLRDKAQRAINKGLCIFVTEYGVVDANGNGLVNASEAQKWWDFNDANKLSYVNWAMDDKNEGSAALVPGTDVSQVGNSSRWTESGKFVNGMLQTPGYWRTNAAMKLNFNFLLYVIILRIIALFK